MKKKKRYETLSQKQNNKNQCARTGTKATEKPCFGKTKTKIQKNPKQTNSVPSIQCLGDRGR